MTLSTRADHRLAEECDIVEDGVSSHVSPEGIAEDIVMEIEGTEDDPAVVSYHEVALRASHEAREAAEDWGPCYTDSPAVVDLAGEGFAERAYDAALDHLVGNPCVTEGKDA